MYAVRDLMQTNLVTVGPEMSVYDLSRLLEEHDISGAPVLDVDGEVLGVVSMTDVIRLAANGFDLRVAPRPFVTSESSLPNAEVEDEEEDLVEYFEHLRVPGAAPSADWASEGDLDQCEVRSIMTPANFHIGPDAPITELAGFLLRGRIHRALVMEDDHLVGIVTTLDVLRAVAEPM